MSRAGSVAILFGALIAAALTPALPALPQPSTIPFAPVNVKLPPAPAAAGFAAFRQHLAAIAKDRVFDELARAVVPQGFFWDRDFTDAFDPKKTSAENLAAAIHLEQGTGLGWQMLADFAAEPTAAEIPTAPGVLCAPGRPLFEQDEFDRLLDTTRSAAADWVFPRADGLELRAAPRPTGALVEKLGSYFLRLARSGEAADTANALRTAWTRVSAPTGKLGFAAPGTLASLSAPQLCYVKDVVGRWRIAGFIGAGN